MLRLFVGLSLPKEVRKILLSRMGGVPDARWQDDRQLHLTLRFLGNVKENQATDIDLALRGLPFEPFELQLEGTGLFGTLRKPRMIWAGVDPIAPLVAIQRKIEAVVTRAGLPTETRKYTPHITMARCNRQASRIDRFLDETADLRSPPWTVDHFVMFRSHLGHKAAHYQAIARYPVLPMGLVENNV
jgi:2'-5' RNA ligase